MGGSFDGSMVNGALCECGCMVHEYVVDGDVLASESLLTPMPGRWVLYHKHGSMPAL